MGTLPGHVAVAIVDRLFASGWWDDLGVLFWRESDWQKVDSDHDYRDGVDID